MSETLVISVDAMGGDHAPAVVIDGIDIFLKMEGEDHDVRFILHGDETKLEALLAKKPRARDLCDVEHTDLAIEMDAKPSHAMRRGKGSSMWNTIEAIKNGRAKVGISAGNTGALMAMSKLQLRTKPGVQRPAIAALWPNYNGMSVVMDAGANIECDAAQLTEFAVLGDAYYRALYGKKHPSIGLLNVGTEEMKGHAELKAAHERLSESKLGLNYLGYVEGNDISAGTADVIVTDGFTGNIALKTAEGTAKLVKAFFEDTLGGSILSKFLAIPSWFSIRKLKKRIDPSKYNGGAFLGLNGIIVKSHGGTDGIGYANALRVAIGLAESDFLQEIDRTLTQLHIEDDNIGFIV